MPSWPSYAPTRFPFLGVSQVERSLWRIVCLDWDGGGTSPRAPACIGPQYRTKGELLGDLRRFAEERGYAPAERREALREILAYADN